MELEHKLTILATVDGQFNTLNVHLWIEQDALEEGVARYRLRQLMLLFSPRFRHFRGNDPL